MARFLHLTSAFQANRADRDRLLAFLLLGSLFGAFGARLQHDALPAFDFGADQGTWILTWLRFSLFPCLLAVSFLLHRRWLFCLLFFLKGAFVSFTLCVFSLCGWKQFLDVLPPLFWQGLLPLPLQLYVASIWLGEERSDGAVLLLFALLLPGLLGVLFRMPMAS